jgi:hypothetical protein
MSDNAIIVHFPIYAGGKFIINCLAMSKYSLLLSCNTVDELIAEPDNYNLRYNAILKTLPPVSDMKQWVSKYEFSDQQAYGIEYNNWKEGRVTLLSVMNANIVKSEMKFFMSAHSIGLVNMIQEMWHDATVISLVRYEEFQQISYKLKGDTTRSIDNANEDIIKYNMLRGYEWPAWEEFQMAGYNVTQLKSEYPEHILDEIREFYPIDDVNKHLVFDMSCIFDKDRFLVLMQRLYKQLSFDDFNKDLIHNYYMRYINLHKIK